MIVLIGLIYVGIVLNVILFYVDFVFSVCVLLLDVCVLFEWCICVIVYG